MEKSYLPLKLRDGRQLYLKGHRFNELKEELEQFLIDEKYMNTLTFAKKVMFSHEIKANNNIEGYTDELDFIKSVTENLKMHTNEEKRLRILNLYKGYKYILKDKEINKETLKELYKILSENLLEAKDQARMGEYYRTAPVYILKKGRLDVEPDTGIEAERIEEFMQTYFDFVTNGKNLDSTESYITSQIMHFYFVHIHPYFDINGRTSRTTAMWYLLNNKSYPYIIFNRAINFEQKNYDVAIREVAKFGDISFFVNYMLENVKKELEKEYIMHQISESSKEPLKGVDYQTLEYFLSMNGLKTVCDFATFYNRLNDKKSVKEIYATMIDSLIAKGIIKFERDTSRCMFDDIPNQVLKLNENNFENNPQKIKRLKL